jgi:hypothetical protein
MAKGEWRIPPTGFTSVEKRWLGWIDDEHTAIVPRGDFRNITLYPLEKDNPLEMIDIPVGIRYYYTVEYRVKNGTDRSLPMSGIIIARVDESRSSGMGIVRIMDNNDITLTLDDAAYHSGDIFIDYDDEVAVKIYSVGSSAKLMVMNGLPDLYVKSVNKTEENGLFKFDVLVVNNGSCISPPFIIKIYVDGSLYKSILVNNTLPSDGGTYKFTVYTPITAGNHDFKVALDPDGRVIEKDEGNNIYDLIYFEPPTYILDKYEGPSHRVDVGSIQVVRLHFSYYMNNTSYADKQVIINNQTFMTDSNGWVNLTVSRDYPTKILWEITDPKAYSIIDTPYTIWDEVNIILSIDRDRYDVGSEPPLKITAYYEYDNQPFKGEIVINDTLVKNEVGRYWFTVSKIIDNKYNLTVFNANRVSIIYDKVIINIEVLDDRIDVGSTPNISINAYYAYDGKIFNGSISFNDTLVKNNVGKYSYRVVNISDRLYGLTVYASNTFGIIFDRVLINLIVIDDRINVGSQANITFKAYYE